MRWRLQVSLKVLQKIQGCFPHDVICEVILMTSFMNNPTSWLTLEGKKFMNFKSIQSMIYSSFKKTPLILFKINAASKQHALKIPVSNYHFMTLNLMMNFWWTFDSVSQSFQTLNQSHCSFATLFSWLTCSLVSTFLVKVNDALWRSCSDVS